MIAIAGAGIAGLASAIALAPFGDVTVFERRNAEAANGGAGIQLSPNAVHALRAISDALCDRVSAAATQPDGLVVRRAGRASPLAHVNYGAVMEPRFGAPYLTISRSALHSALLDSAAERATIQIVSDTAVTRADPSDGGWRLSGPDANSAFAVAADGVNSALRNSVLGDVPLDTGFVAWRGLGDAPSNTTSLTLMHGRHLVRYALASGGDNVVLVDNVGSGSPQTITDKAARDAIADVSGWTPWPIAARPHHWFGSATLAAVGDAAHAMVPFLAQGGAMALEDVAELKGAVVRHGLTAAAVATYTLARRRRTEQAARTAKQQGLIYHMPPPLSLARDLAMAQLGQGGILRRVSWVYDWRPTLLS